MRRALNRLRASQHYRREAFDAGLRACGFELVESLPNPAPGDVYVTWNRYGGWHEEATQVEASGARVVVVENGWLGKGWRGGEWFAMSIGHHAGAGSWPDNGPSRWNDWRVPLAPFRHDGIETVILGQRSIGEPGIASPAGWETQTQRRIGGRIRQHPAVQTRGIRPLADDLAHAREVVTWNSGAALVALTLGLPVWHDFDRWIGAEAACPLSMYGTVEPNRDAAARLRMFQRLAWAMWSLDEVRSGVALRCLLGI